MRLTIDLAGDRDGLVVGRKRADLDEGFVPGLIPAAVGLDEGIELLPRRQDAALAFDGAAAFVAHFGLDGVAVVAVALFGFGAGGVNFEREGAVGGELALAFGDQLAQGFARAAFVAATPRVGVAAIVAPREPEARSIGVMATATSRPNI